MPRMHEKWKRKTEKEGGVGMMLMMIREKATRRPRGEYRCIIPGINRIVQVEESEMQLGISGFKSPRQSSTPVHCRRRWWRHRRCQTRERAKKKKRRCSSWRWP